MRHRAIGPLIAALLLLSELGVATAGGWATIELVEPLDDAVAGDVVALNITVLEHGVTPADYERVVVTATHADSGAVIEVNAAHTGETGMYRAEIVFDLAGRWKLRAEVKDLGIGTSFKTAYVREKSAESAESPAALQSSFGDVVEINIVGGVFAPSQVTVKPGVTVRFTNSDVIKHEVAFVPAQIDDSGILEPGESFEVTFPDVDRYIFVCGPHPGMMGMVWVED